MAKVYNSFHSNSSDAIPPTSNPAISDHDREPGISSNASLGMFEVGGRLSSPTHRGEDFCIRDVEGESCPSTLRASQPKDYDADESCSSDESSFDCCDCAKVPGCCATTLETGGDASTCFSGHEQMPTIKSPSLEPRIKRLRRDSALPVAISASSLIGNSVGDISELSEDDGSESNCALTSCPGATERLSAVIDDGASGRNPPLFNVPLDFGSSEEAMQLDEGEDEEVVGAVGSRRNWIALTSSLLSDAAGITNEQERVRQVYLVAKFYRQLQASGKI